MVCGSESLTRHQIKIFENLYICYTVWFEESYNFFQLQYFCSWGSFVRHCISPEIDLINNLITDHFSNTCIIKPWQYNFKAVNYTLCPICFRLQISKSKIWILKLLQLFLCIFKTQLINYDHKYVACIDDTWGRNVFPFKFI